MEKLIPFIVAAVAWIAIYKYFIKKDKGRIISHSAGFAFSIVALLLTIIVIAPNKEYQVLRVSDYHYTLGNKPAVSIALGEDSHNYIDITILKENLINGLTIDTREVQKASNTIDITGQWNNKTYFKNSKKNDSYAKLQIITFDKEKKEATFSIESILYSNDKDMQKKTINTTFKITDKNFSNLIKNI